MWVVWLPAPGETSRPARKDCKALNQHRGSHGLEWGEASLPGACAHIAAPGKPSDLRWQERLGRKACPVPVRKGGFLPVPFGRWGRAPQAPSRLLGRREAAISTAQRRLGALTCKRAHRTSRWLKPQNRSCSSMHFFLKETDASPLPARHHASHAGTVSKEVSFLPSSLITRQGSL